jgi:hypothetical protein
VDASAPGAISPALAITGWQHRLLQNDRFLEGKQHLTPHPPPLAGLQEEQIPAGGRLTEGDVLLSGVEFRERRFDLLESGRFLGRREAGLRTIGAIHHMTAEQERQARTPELLALGRALNRPVERGDAG